MKSFIKILNINFLLLSILGLSQNTEKVENKDTVQVKIDLINTSKTPVDSVFNQETHTFQRSKRPRKFRIRRNSRMTNRVKKDSIGEVLDEVKKAFLAEKRMQERQQAKKDSLKK